MRVRKVGVIGAGVMGAGIAAHFANAGFECVLLDILDSKSNDRSAIAKKGIATALASKPAAFFAKSRSSLVRPGNLEDDLEQLRSCDLVVEAVLENLDIKKSLYKKIAPFLNPQAILTSNTSGLLLKDLTKDLSSDLKKRFLITHFFNPPRYLKLLEIVKGPDTDSKLCEKLAEFMHTRLGKGVVFAKDTPNFIANRIGVFAMLFGIDYMQKNGYSVEEMDAIFGPATGRPKSALFRTSDLVGLDTLKHVADNCYRNLPQDEVRELFKIPPFMEEMIKRGWLGQKSGQGFYKKQGNDILALDIKTFEYQPKQKVRFDSLGKARNIENLEERIKTIVESDDRASKAVREILGAVCRYAAKHMHEIADSEEQIDNAMKWGFGWELGPFETARVLRIENAVIPVKTGIHRESVIPVKTGIVMNTNTHSDASLRWHDKEMGLKKQTIDENMSASLIDIGDEVLVCEFHSKMNAIDGDILKSINHGLDLCESGRFKAFILANDGKNFSVGANVFLLYMAAMQQQFDEIAKMATAFQDTSKRLRYSSIPTVAAPFNLTLGGGTEFSLWCNRIYAHAELYMGLVEVGVGLIPGGGGNIEMLARTLQGSIDSPHFVSEPFIRRAFENIAMAKVATSAVEAQEMLFLGPADTFCMNRDDLLYGAKITALSMAETGFRPPLRRYFRLPGKSAGATFAMVIQSMRDGDFISDHDQKIALKLAHILTGGDCSPRELVSEDYLLELEKEAFLSLCGEAKTLERIAYMLEHNKPLRN